MELWRGMGAFLILSYLIDLRFIILIAERYDRYMTKKK